MSSEAPKSDGLECSYSTKPARLIDSSVTRRYLATSSRPRSLKRHAPNSGSSESSSPPLSPQTYDNLKRQLVEDILYGSGFTGEHRVRLKSLLRERLDERLEESANPTAQPASSSLSEPESEPHFASELSFIQLVSSLLDGRSDKPTNSLSSFIDGQEGVQEEHSFLESHPPLEVLTPSSFPTIELARVLVRSFNEFVNKFLPIFSENETKGLLISVYGGLQPVPRTVICQLCMIFALGDQASNQQNRSSSIFWFENGRRYLDEILNDSGEAPLWTLRVYLMVAVYYISRKRNASRHYVELAVGLTRSHPELVQVGQEPYLGCTLVILDRYLSIFLGRKCLIPGAEACHCVQEVSPVLEHSIPKRFASLSFIAGQILEEVYPSHQIRSSVYEGYLQQLDLWVESLPVSLRVLLQTGSIELSSGMPQQGFDGDGLNTQLAYLTVRMLLSRPLLVRSVIETRGRSDHHSPDAGVAASMTAKFAGICAQSAMEYIRISDTHFVNKKLQTGCWFLIHGVFNAFLVVVLEALRQARLEGHSIGRSGGLDQVRMAITISVSLLEYHSEVNEAASLYLKVVRSLDRSLSRVLATKTSGFGHGSELTSGADPLPLQNNGPQYGWLEQQPEPQPQPLGVFVGSPGLQTDNASENSNYLTFRGEQELGHYHTAPLGYSHTSTIPNWQSPEFGVDESIDPSLLSPGLGFPQQDGYQ
ncbi:MAG: hypothetical protein M1840_000274 [Geoglossum simile]|nr:MAG: hypothetical protein M1840_000274 [Geoglossum simile]